MNFPLANHANAARFALAAERVRDRDRFWQMRDFLFSNRQAPLTTESLVRHGTTLGVDPGYLQSCIKENLKSDAIRSQQAEAQRLGVSATPTFFFGEFQSDNSVRLTEMIDGAWPFEVFQKALSSDRYQN
jgi:protein-disulfide isomerase